MTLYQELIALKKFRTQPFQTRTLEFRPPVHQFAQAGDPRRVDSASIYRNKINFSKHRKITKSGQKLCQQNEH